MDNTLLQCKCCRNPAKGAHESECCAILYCGECSKTSIVCPSCKEEDVALRRNLFVDKLLISRGNDITPSWMNQPGFDLAIPLVNETGLTARLGASGKYYCGQPRECSHVLTRVYNPNCSCICCKKELEPGLCGPSTGCNCSPFQKLDIATRGLPNGWLVAPDGTLAQWHVDRRQPLNGRFTCGRRFEQIVQGERKSWMEKLANAVGGSNAVVVVRYCGSGRAICPNCICLYEHVMFGNQYRAIIGLSDIPCLPIGSLVPVSEASEEGEPVKTGELKPELQPGPSHSG